MQCEICESRKGKRYCPARRACICATCCGQKRVLEIACPDDCVYLSSGQSYQSIKKLKAQLRRSEDCRVALEMLAARRSLIEALWDFEEELLEDVAEGGLSDVEILEAVRLLEISYRTETRGVICFHRSTHPRVDALCGRLRRFLEEARQDEPPLYEPPLDLDELLLLLECVRSDIEFHVQPAPTRDSYIDFTRRNHPHSSRASIARSIKVVRA